MDGNQIGNEVLKDYAKDARGYVHLLKVVVVCLCIIISLLIVGYSVAITIIVTNHQKQTVEIANHSTDIIAEFLSEYDWEVEYEILSTNNELFSGNIVVEK